MTRGASNPSPENSPQRDELVRRLIGAPPADRARVAGEVQELLHQALAPGLIRHFARRLGRDAELADELAQRTWIMLWEALAAGKYDPAKSRLSTFTYAVAQIVWMRFARERGREQRGDGGQERMMEMAAGRQPPDAAADLAAGVELVRRALSGEGGFDDRDRAVLRAIGEGRTDREVAALLGISGSTANERKKTVLRRLADYLQGRGFGEDSGRAPGAP